MTSTNKSWHTLEGEEAILKAESSIEGLSSQEAQKRLHEHGANSLQVQESVTWQKMMISQIHNPLIYLLFGAAALSLVAGKFIDSGVIIGVIILNSLLGFFQEWRAEGALAALRQMAALHAKVLRDGKPVSIDASEVVYGDILLLETGDRIAADAVLLQSDELNIDESALTGESQPAEKYPGILDETTPTADQHNMAWMSTNVTAGRGKALVVKTGMQTQIGQISDAVQSTSREMTPLQKRMHTLGIVLGAGGIVLALVVLGLELIKGFKVVESIMFAVAIAVSAIPEGLPAVISVTLALGVRRMADHNAIIRHMPAVETLGSITVICTDKTGTLTKNQMTVRQLWADGNIYKLTGEGYQPEGILTTSEGENIDVVPEALEKLLQIGILNNNARLVNKDNKWQAQGNPSDAALLCAARKRGLDPETVRNQLKRIHEIPLSSERKYMATLNHNSENNSRQALVKGAPDRILNFCSHIMINGERIELNEQRKKEVENAIEAFAEQALRVIAGAYNELDSGQETISTDNVESGLTLVGLWAMIDPPREESVEAVRQAIEAGIRPVMITGDHAATALAIAKQVGIAGDGKVITGSEIDDMDKPALAEAAIRSCVFARVSPAHKLKITDALREMGHVVAMTGDGVNDAPALKGADIGVAMGQSGTEVAKEAADMILTDDNFATIVKAVEEGRVIFSNLRRVVFFLIATNIGEILTMVVALLMGMDLPLTAVMILWVNLATDGACTIPLGLEPKHWDVLKQPPRDPKESILNRSLVLRTLIVTPVMAAGTLIMFKMAQPELDLAHARTVAFTTLVAFQWFQAFNARSQFQSIFSIGLFSNRWLLGGVGLAIILQILVIHTPLGQTLFGTTSMSATDWFWTVLTASSITIIDEILKITGAYGRLPKNK